LNIVVLAGGLSPERDVSLLSGSLIAKSLIRSSHKVILLDVYMGIDLCGKAPIEMFTDTFNEDFIIGDTAPDLDEVKRRNNNQKELIGKNVLALCQAADVVFIALHGDMGENGQLQATFDNFSIKYTGSGYIGSLLAMDKDLTKRIISIEGICTANWIYCNLKNDCKEQILTEIGLPCVVKPCSCGSSVGVSLVYTYEQLEAALKFAGLYEKNIVVEKLIKGREFSAAILGNEPLPPIEIIPKDGFYDYKNKYQSGKTVEECPAKLTAEQLEKINKASIRVFKCLRLCGYARIDFILGDDGEFYCLEANTLPGMTPFSLLPQEAAAAGLDYDALCERIAMYGVTIPNK